LDKDSFLCYRVATDDEEELHQLRGVPVHSGRGRPIVMQQLATVPMLQQRLAAVQASCRTAAEVVVADLRTRFPPTELLTALAIVQPAAWQDSIAAKASLSSCLEVLKEQYCTDKRCTTLMACRLGGWRRCSSE
jgi:hypothetical protein